MPPQAAVAPAAGGDGRQPQAAGGTTIISTILRMAFMWWVMGYLKKSGQTAPKKDAPEAANFSYPRIHRNAPVDMYAFIADSRQVRNLAHGATLIWSEKDLVLGNITARQLAYEYVPTERVQRNGSLWLHVIFAEAGKPVDPTDPEYDEDALFGNVVNLIRYLPKPKNATGVSLLSEDPTTVVVPDPKEPREIVSFMKPNMTVQLVDHFAAHNKAQIPPTVAPFLQYDPKGNYYPIVHFNEFWMLRDKLVPMNESVTNVTLHLEVGMVAEWWWTLMLQMDLSFQKQIDMGMAGEGESDEIKRVFLEGNPILLAVTMCVSLLHTVFDMLAFKNDIGFWKNNKSMEGLSARTVTINAFCQLVILLYLMDNETSWMVLLSSFLGTGIEFWKVTKAFKVEPKSTFPYLCLKDRASSVQTKTKQYDEEATKYLSYVLYPLVIGYAIYSLVYKTHKSWYSWIVSSLVGAVYMFGFILMCPQLYLNWKLKSVAHLPWRQMTYKFLNTIIDDLFAFVIKMPTLHRLSVFRDDLIFMIFLYQRWIYKIDKKRVNEFGWAAETDGPEGEAQAQLEGPPGEAAGEGQDEGAEAAPAEDKAEGEREEEEEEGSSKARKRKGGKGQGGAGAEANGSKAKAAAAPAAGAGDKKKEK